MKNIFKVFTLVLLALFAVVALTACDSKKADAELLSSYLLEVDGKTLSSDFVLPAELKVEEKGEEKVYPLSWASNSEVIKIEKRESDYLAKVSYPDQETEVKITVTLGKASKDFTVRVNPIDVYNFSGTYAFPNDKQKVYADFDLDQSCQFAGKTATITWSVSEAYQNYIKISEDGKKCLVFPNSLEPSVKIKATFKYNNVETTKTYNMTVSQELTHEEAVSSWYNNPGSPNNFAGWIVEIATVYSEQYGNVSFYVLDENEDAGYYGYRVKVAAADASKIKVGAYVKVTGSTNAMYKGLMETNAGALAEFDESKNLTAEQMAQKVYAIDEDAFAGSPAAFFNQSRLVSLSNWKITKVGGEKDKFLFEIEKEGVKVQVSTSKYYEGAYDSTKEDQMKPFKDLQTTLAVDDYISVKGIWSRYEEDNPEDLTKGLCIYPLSASDVVKVEAEAEGTAHPGKSVNALINELNKVMPDKLVASDRDITFLTEKDGAKVELSLLRPGTTIIIDNTTGLLQLRPAVEEKVSLIATFSNGEFSTKLIYILHMKAMTSDELVEAALDELELDNIDTFGDLPYPEGNDMYGVKFTYELVSEQTDNVKVVEGKIQVSPLAEEDITLKVIASVGEGEGAVTKEKQYSVKLLKLETSTIAEFLKMKKGDMAILEGTVVAVNKDSGNTAFVLKDATGAIFSYSGAKVVLGEQVKLVAKLDFNNDTPQMANIQIIEQVAGAEADLAKAVEAAGTPVELEVSDIHDKLVGTETVAKLDTDKKLVSEYSGKFLKIHGYIVMKGNYAQLMAEASYEDVAAEKGFANVYAAPSISAASFAGKEVNLFGFFRGDSLGNYITIQVTKIEFVNAEDAADCLTGKDMTVVAGEDAQAAEITKAPWALDVDLVAESAATDKVEVTVVEGKVMVKGLAEAEEVMVTITPMRNGEPAGNSIQIKVSVSAADAEPMTLAEFLAQPKDTEGLLLEGIVTSVKSNSSGKVSFHLTDAEGTTVFCYDGLSGIFLGQQIRITAKRGDNYGFPQIATPQLLSADETVKADNLEAALAALPATAAVSFADLKAAVLAESASVDSVLEVAGNYLLILECYMDGTKLYAEKGDTSFNASVYGNQDFGPFDKKVVIVKALLRGVNLTNKYAQVAVLSIEESADQPIDEPDDYEYVGEGTLDNPYTVEDALHLAADFSVSKYDNKEKKNVYGDLAMIFVKGIVVEEGQDKGNYQSNFKLATLKDAEQQLLVFSASETETIVDVRLNDEVIVHGYIMNYNGTIEVSSAQGPEDQSAVNAEFAAITRGENDIVIDEDSSEHAHITLSAESGLNGSEFTFTVLVDEGNELVGVYVNGQAVEATEGVYTGKVSGITKVLVETRGEGEVVPELAATLTFIAENGSLADGVQTWTKDGITVTNSTTAASLYSNPARFYANSTIKIAYTSEMVKLVFHCDNASYATVLGNALEGSKVSGSDVTFTLPSAALEFTTPSLSAQVRITSIDVYTMPAE